MIIQGVRFGPLPWQFETYDNIICANCHKRGHKLRTCMGPTNNHGFIEGCPKCNSKAHNFENCPRMSTGPFSRDQCRRMKTTSSIHRQLLLSSRANRPPIYFSGDIRSVPGFDRSVHRPWTPDFALLNGGSWVHHVYRKDPKLERTVRDPAWEREGRVQELE